MPAIFVAIFAVGTLNLGIEQWFAPRVQSAVDNSIAIAQRYEDEHEKSIITDALAIATGIQQDPQLFDADKKVRADILFTKLGEMTKDRGLQAAYIYDSHRTLLGSTKERGITDTKPPSEADIVQAMGASNCVDDAGCQRRTIVIDANSRIGVVRAMARSDH